MKLSESDLESGRALVKQRWAARHNCDLHETTWKELFDQFDIGVLLEAVKRCGTMADPRPERHYQRFQRMLERLTPSQN